MENRFKLTISRMFRGSYGSCRPARDSPDIIEKPQPPQKHPYFRLFDHPPPPKTPPFPSICRPNCPETTAKSATDPFSPRRKIYPPSISPSPPLNPFYKNPKNPRKNNNNNHKSNISYPRTNLSTLSSQESYINPKNLKKKKNNKNNNISYPRRNLFTSSSQDSAYYNGKNYSFSSDNKDEEERDDLPLNPFYKNPKHPKKKNNNSNKNNRNSYPRRNLFTSSSQDSNYYNGKNFLFSEDGEEPQSLLFSSKGTLSSCSSRPRRHRGRRRRRKSGVAGKVEDSFVVVKRSSDPYRDFRKSMVEMIVEKQIFATYDLEKLLQNFLSLNSVYYHCVIVEVFVEVYDVLFSNWS